MRGAILRRFHLCCMAISLCCFSFHLFANNVEWIETYSVKYCQAVLAKAGFKEGEFEPKYAVQIFKVSYETPELSGVPTDASGFYARPVSSDRGVSVIYFHGTVTSREQTPSRGSVRLQACLYGGQGLGVMAPDYIGLGDSLKDHPYLHTQTTVNAGRYLTLALKHSRLGTQLGRKLLISGYSQGGHAAACAHRDIEFAPIEGFNLIGSTPMAGPYELYPLTLNESLKNPEPYFSSLYFAYILKSYSAIYPNIFSSKDEVFFAEYRDVLDFFDGTRPSDSIARQLPELPTQLIRPEYIKEVTENDQSPLARALRENSIEPWPARKPVVFIYAGGDRSVTPKNALNTYSRMVDLGAQVGLVNVGSDLSHASGFVPSMKASMEYFEILLAF